MGRIERPFNRLNQHLIFQLLVVDGSNLVGQLFVRRNKVRSVVTEDLLWLSASCHETMERHKERVAVEFVGDFDVNCAGHETREEATVSLRRTTAELDIHGSEVVDTNKRERRLSRHKALRRKV